MAQSASIGQQDTARRLWVWAGLALGLPIGLGVLALCALLARLAVGPISIDWTAEALRERLSERLHYAYDVEFDDVLIDWPGSLGGVELRLERVKIRDHSREVIGEVPAIAARVPIGRLLIGNLAPSELRLERPLIRWLATTGGAVKFDVGGSRPGISGKILEDLMIYLAAAPRAEASEAAERPTPPTLVLDQADITIGSEVDGSRLRSPAARVVATPGDEGVLTVFDLALEGGAERGPRLLARSLFRTADQRITLDVEVTDIRPRQLLALVPALAPIAGLDAPASGSVTLDMDKFFTVRAGTFDVRLGPGAIIHGPWSATVAIESGEIVGHLADSGRDVAIETLKLDFGGPTLDGRLDLDGDGQRQRFGLEASVDGVDRAALAAGWPAALGGNAGFWLATTADTAAPIDLTLTGTRDVVDDRVSIEGVIKSPATTIRVTGTLAAPLIDVAP